MIGLEKAIIGLAVCGAIVSVSFGAGYMYAGKRNAERLVAKQEKQAVTIDKIVTKYVTKWKTREVVKYVPASNECGFLSNDFRLYHDSAVMPEATRIADGRPVAVTDVAETIGANYLRCAKTAGQLTALQEWAAVVSN